MTEQPGKRAAGVPRRGTGGGGMPKLTREPRAPTGRWPFVVAGLAVVALLITVGTVGFLSLRPPADPLTPTAGPAPTGVPELPQELGEHVRAPTDNPSSDPTPDAQGRLMTTGTYLVEGRESIIVTAVRPAGDPTEVLTAAGATAIRQVDGGVCGRESSFGLDVCATARRSTVVLVIGWRGQTLQELVSVARQFANVVG